MTTLNDLAARATVTEIGPSYSRLTHVTRRGHVVAAGVAVWCVVFPDVGEGSVGYRVKLPAHRDHAVERAAAIAAIVAVRCHSTRAAPAL